MGLEQREALGLVPLTRPDELRVVADVAELVAAGKVRYVGLGEAAPSTEEKGVTPAQLALAWVLAKGDDVVPIPGTKRRRYLEENARAPEIELTADDLARIDAELPEAAGTRHDEAGMQTVNV